MASRRAARLRRRSAASGGGQQRGREAATRRPRAGRRPAALPRGRRPGCPSRQRPVDGPLRLSNLRHGLGRPAHLHAQARRRAARGDARRVSRRRVQDPRQAGGRGRVLAPDDGGALPVGRRRARCLDQGAPQPGRARRPPGASRTPRRSGPTRAGATRPSSSTAGLPRWPWPSSATTTGGWP